MREQNGRQWGFATAQVHAGSVLDRGHGSRVDPIHLTAGYVFDDFDHSASRFAGEDGGLVYSRLGNPTVAAAEHRIAALEGGIGAVLTASGQAATTVALLALLKADDHVVSGPSIYGGSRAILHETLGGLGVTTTFVDQPSDLDAWRAAIRPTTRVVFAETLPHPKNDLVDVEGIAGVAHDAGLPFVVDNTIPTPFLLRPLEWGADVVVHSASKFLAGHGAALGGAIVSGSAFDWSTAPIRHLTEPSRALRGETWSSRFGAAAFLEHARQSVAARIGPTASPFNAFLVKQGIETLSLRMRQHSANALVITRWLEAQPEIESVDYAGLPSNRYNGLARKYLPRGAGSVFACTFRDGLPAARVFINALSLFTRMTHIGDVRSLVLHPATTTHAKVPPADRASMGIGDGHVRLSVGIEEQEDLLADLEQAFDAVRQDRTAAQRDHPA
ncbi:PLP-dependent transferase [Curtobacterium sp. BRB10]|uniref:O-acetylhomoserine aminocarboxypropyltransferase/cysteine synthase family protein n=1 Tax=Curtobacterium sp. BRB10 TaxID=2962579 RepID=UPI0028819E17|nr:PLP-dependent transferase [Curtobacterium sp. BRB10]MDT0234804.1 PLP-dependent transferase [Curtobacterium sp. BRB10]